MRSVLRILLVLVLAFAAHATRADEPWPSKPVKIVVPSSPGGGTDVFARLLAQAMSDALKQPFVVENRPGANGNIGAEAVAHSKPDGYTLLVAANASLAINPEIQKSSSFDPAQDLTPVSRAVVSVNVLIAHPGAGGKTLPEFIAAAKKSPGAMAFGSAGSGTAPYLGVRMIEEQAGVKFLHAPYKGVGPAYQDLIAGRLQFMYTDLASALQYIQSGMVVALAIDRKTPMLPDVPTFAEGGLPKFDAPISFSVMAPAGIAPALLQRIAQEISAALRPLAPRLEKQGLIAVHDTPAEFAASLAAERAVWGQFIRRNDIRADQ